MTAAPLAPNITMSQAVRRLGGVPPHRIRLTPYPATEADLVALIDRENSLFELVDGILVEKAMSYESGYLASALVGILRAFVVPRNLGAVNGPDGGMRVHPGQLRMPDVSFVTWDQLPGRQVPRGGYPVLCPALAVEVLSPSNTAGEMDVKLAEYFAGGTRLAWIVDPDARTVDVFRSPDRTAAARLTAADTLTGDPVLPGFELKLADLFAELDPH